MARLAVLTRSLAVKVLVSVCFVIIFLNVAYNSNIGSFDFKKLQTQRSVGLIDRTVPTTRDVTARTVEETTRTNEVINPLRVVLNMSTGPRMHEEQPKRTLPVCPFESPYLKGLGLSTKDPITPEELMVKFPYMFPGGRHRPEDCLPVERVAVIIPYRNRWEHLHILLSNLIPLLHRQQADFNIFVIEQDLPTTFNRGMLFNVGFKEALKVDNFDCFVFHDVDMFPVNDHCLYRCANNPVHLTAAVSTWEYSVPYHSNFGGVVAFSRDQFEQINGCSNLYFGWGGEDDDARRRLSRKKFNFLRYPPQIGRYDTMTHERDTGNGPNRVRKPLLRAAQRQDVEGLSSTVYTVTKREFRQLYTWVSVFINMTEILQAAPDAVLEIPGIQRILAKSLKQPEVNKT